MRHLKGIKKLKRTGAHRRALLRNMAIALFRHERIHTTAIKAKVLRGFAERLITLARSGTLADRRQAARDVHDSVVLQKLFNEIGPRMADRARGCSRLLYPRMADRAGGYTRVLKTGVRRGDNSATALIELTDRAPAIAAAAPAAAEG